MIACASDEVVMGKHSFLGPTDPQIMLPTHLGIRWVPAQSILDQFDKAQRECSTPDKLASWLPMLGQYGPDLLVQCETALDLSKELVRTWLEDYMFRQAHDRLDKASSVADWFANHKSFKSHGRHLSRTDLESQGLTITRLEDDEELQDLSLSIFHATTHTFDGTPAIKIVESHTGRAFVKGHIPPQNPA